MTLRGLVSSFDADLKSLSRDAAATVHGWPGGSRQSAIAMLTSFERSDASTSRALHTLADALEATAATYGRAEDENRGLFGNGVFEVSEQNDEGHHRYGTSRNA